MAHENEHDLTAERIAQNQSTFRAANEDIEAAAQALAPELPRVPFICECLQTGCTRTIRLRLAEYEAVRADPTHFVVLPEHEFSEVDGERIARVVARETGYSIMEKVGDAGEEARRLDRRTNGDPAAPASVAEQDA